jgi:hypothetical protein
MNIRYEYNRIELLDYDNLPCFVIRCQNCPGHGKRKYCKNVLQDILLNKGLDIEFNGVKITFVKPEE